jgi:hypothetical protein
MPAPVAQAVWRERAAKVNIELLADVIDSNTKVSARCLTCGRTWDATPRHIREGRRCQSCAARAGAGSRRVPQHVWQERAGAANLEWLEDVTSGHTKTLARCLSCGHEWRVLPTNVHQGHGCPHLRHGVPLADALAAARADLGGLPVDYATPDAIPAEG